MKIIIIGNGLAGTIAAKTLREQDKKAEIAVYSDEKYLYYPRPNLIEFLSGKLPFNRVFAFLETWYMSQNIQIHLGKAVRKIVPDSREIEVESGEKAGYDKLLLACGASAFIPPFKGAEKSGIFTLRSLEDGLRILEYLKSCGTVAVIGGGVLGLEIARALKDKGVEVRVVEFAEYLLPRQLDLQAASLLKAQIEKMGIKVHLNAATEEILGRDRAGGVRFKNGEEIRADMVIVAAGVRANLGLARDAGLQVDRGVAVNDFLETSRPDIFAAGDGIQHNGKIYGIIPAAFDQARIAASNILGQNIKYAGTMSSNTLKVVGLYVTSIGLVNPQTGDYEEIRLKNEDQGIYKKIVLQNDVPVGAIWMGTKNGVNGITQAISQGANIGKWKSSLLDEGFDFSLL